MTRTYQKKGRAESQDRTRQKIVEAAVALHQSKGIIATSMSDIAERAEVGRVTVYRHFPDMETMMVACSGLYGERHPLPDLEAWRAIADPSDRLRHALQQIYAYHHSTAAMMRQVLAEARDHPVMADYHQHWHQAVAVLLSGWPARGRQKKLLRAALTLAISFETWQSLERQGDFSEAQKLDLMCRLTCDCA